MISEIYCLSHETQLPYLSKYMSSWMGILVGLGTVVTIFVGRIISSLLWLGAVLMVIYYCIRFLFFKDAFASSSDWIEAGKIVGGLIGTGAVFWLFGSDLTIDGGGGGCPSGPFPPGPNTRGANTPPPERILVCRYCGAKNPSMKPGFISVDHLCAKSPNGYHQLI